MRVHFSFFQLCISWWESCTLSRKYLQIPQPLISLISIYPMIHLIFLVAKYLKYTKTLWLTRRIISLTGQLRIHICKCAKHERCHYMLASQEEQFGCWCFREPSWFDIISWARMTNWIKYLLTSDVNLTFISDEISFALFGSLFHLDFWTIL